MSRIRPRFRCRFCRERLTPVPVPELSLLQVTLSVLCLRPHECPHCFQLFTRPRQPFDVAFFPAWWLWTRFIRIVRGPAAARDRYAEVRSRRRSADPQAAAQQLQSADREY